MPTLEVPGAVIHHQLEGTGPLLLIAQSGEGDADRTVDLAAHLKDAYTVLTYDRRGLSRSRLEHPATIADHADDVHQLLAHLTDEPVAMLGCSLGAVIGLHVAAANDVPADLTTVTARIVAAAGTTTPRTVFDYQCAESLAKLPTRNYSSSRAATTAI
ncbi:alpha/beta hydrolase [Kribbella sp. NBC_00662]|uniref:alpha/beta fold hydrolase n=1 Tax=Kribbella sp. NBC_00662 TaxID=2975969 RepID=UPI00325309F6